MSQLLAALKIVNDTHQLILSEETPDSRDALAKALFNITHATRWNLLKDEESLDELWKLVRTDELVTDYVLRATSIFLVHFGYLDGDVDRVVGQVSTGLGWLETTAIVDAALTERCGTQVWFARVFKSAPWMLYLYLLSMLKQV
jgi:hypothetical protein